MAGWHHWLHERESGWTPGVGDGQGGLACCDSWGCKESDMTKRLNWTELVNNIVLNTLKITKRVYLKYSYHKKQINKILKIRRGRENFWTWPICLWHWFWWWVQDYIFPPNLSSFIHWMHTGFCTSLICQSSDFWKI